jgi:hypothetical protein
MAIVSLRNFSFSRLFFCAIVLLRICLANFFTYSCTSFSIFVGYQSDIFSWNRKNSRVTKPALFSKIQKKIAQPLPFFLVRKAAATYAHFFLNLSDELRGRLPADSRGLERISNCQVARFMALLLYVSSALRKSQLTRVNPGQI